MQDSPKPHVSSSFSYSTSTSSSPTDSPLGRGGVGGGNRLPSFMRRLTRQRKLRHVTDEELGLRKVSKSVPVSPQATPTYRAPGGSDPWWSTAVPQPLPLPEFASARVNSGWPNDGSGYGAGSNPTQIVFKKNNHHVGAKIVKTPTYFRRGFHKDLSLDSQNLRLKVPVRSAPTSNLPSPTVSPQKPSVWDFTNKLAAPLSQRWSARELAPSNIPGHFSPEPAARTSRSLDHSPCGSPTQRHTNFNPKSARVIPILFHHKSPSEASTLSNDGNVNAKLHPLPLPPSPQPLSQSSDASHNMEKPYLSPRKGEWQKGKLIGRGTFGRVYVATNRITGALCAMKEVDLMVDDPRHAESIMQLKQEIEILQQLKHPNIVQYYGSEIIDDQFYIYMEYVHPGSINTYVREHFGCMTESIVRHFTRHILCGLAYLHSTNTIHRDIKGANLLVDSMGTVKLADFGMAKHLKGPVSVLSLKGSPYWMAPEVLQGTINKETSPSIAFAVDIWSVGCTVIEMLTGKPPWGELEGPQAMFKVLNKSPEIPENLSSEGKDFLQCCFRRNPVERPSAHWLLQHPFVRNIHDEDASIITQPFSKLKFEGTHPAQ